MQFDINGPVVPEPRARFTLSRIRSYERWIIAGLILLCAIVGFWFISAPGNFPRNSLVTIPEGSSAQSFGRILADTHYIRSEFLFRAFAHLTGFDHRLDTGTYAFTKPESLPIVLWRIEKGEHGIAPVRVTITEGMTRFDIARTLEASVPGFDSNGFLEESSTSEGYLFPETYFFMPGDEPRAIVNRLTAQFASSTATIAPDLAASKHSEKDIVIMASILEREANTPEDMRIVAGILWNRIKNGMPLQVDATFGYAHQQNGYTPTAADLTSDSPYNTYKNRGLPPTPISNPGLEALTAAANPAPTKYVYYLTGTDGKMHYAVTFEEHKANKAKYLK
ncbi:MAG TPA: endolytic transglycosylase MltG [Candidatus Paceibacterota bacterium]|nr:endolytic transglycosylase MltG [Candidatus Paceibacterota bacterium]